MKNFIKRILPAKFFSLFYPEKINVLEERLKNLFIAHYADLGTSNQKDNFRNSEFKVFSKHGGDGIIAYIFSKVGVTNCTFVEMGIEDGRECNAANLIKNFGWSGLLIDANQSWVESAREFFKNYKVEVAHSFVTAENINETLREGEIDLLSIDIDGNDYWVWKAISGVNPRVVVLEYNSSFGLRSVTQKYQPEHKFNPKEHPLFFGASLTALTKLSKEKGYILVACDTHGHDAFFIRADLASGKFKELSPEEAFYPNPFNLRKYGDLEKQFDLIKHLDLIEV